jgi:hypothetical protein
MDINTQSPMPHPEHDDEGKMAKADLYKTAKYSLKLFKMMEDNAQLEGWVQAKITKAADYLASVYHYLEYEMKFTEYGRAIEDSEMYTESEKKILKKKLFEAKEKVKDLKKAQAEKIKAKDKKKVKENAVRLHPGHGISIKGKEVDTDSLEVDGVDMRDYPDFVDAYFSYGEFMDGSEMSQDELDHLRDKEGGLLYDKVHDSLHESGLGEDGDERGGDDDTKSDFNKITTSSGHTRHSRKASRTKADHVLKGVVPMTSLHPGHDERGAQFLGKQVHGTGQRVSPMDKLTKRKGMTDLDEAKAKKAKKDYDGDGKVETGKDEVIGSRRKAAGLPFKEAAEKKCNHTAKGKSCPVHGMKECSGMMAEQEKTMSRAAKGVMKYGKDGMKALAQAGKDGKDLDKVRNKYDKYDEATEPKDLPTKGTKMGKEGNAFGKAVQDAKASGDKTVTVGGKTMPVKETSKPSTGMSKGEKSAVAKKAQAGKDIGKPGKSFDKVAKAAGGGAKGTKIAAAAMWKNQAK